MLDDMFRILIMATLLDANITYVFLAFQAKVLILDAMALTQWKTIYSV